MGQREDYARQILERRLSRRDLLIMGGAVPLSAAFLAACSAAATPSPTAAPTSAPPVPTAAPPSPTAAPTASPAPSASATAAATASPAPSASAAPSPTASPSPSPAPSASAARFDGVTIQVWSGGTVFPPTQQAAKEWGALTGGTAVVTLVPGAERALKFAGLIAAQDASIDLLYASDQFVHQFGTRLYANLSDPSLNIDPTVFVPAEITDFTYEGGLLALPLHSEMEIYIYNKTMFNAAGLDADNPPNTWDGLYAAATKLNVGKVFGCGLGWLTNYDAAAYFCCFINSIPGAKIISDDFTQVLFGDANGLAAFEAIGRGMTAKFFDPNFDASVEDYTLGKLFNAGKTASQINFSELWGYAVGGDLKDYPTTLKPEEVGASIVPGISAGDSGSTNGFEGFGVSKFSTKQAAALSFLQYLTGPVAEKEMNSAPAASRLPSSRLDVLSDPAIQASFPVGSVLAAQGKFNLNRYGAPYDWTPPVADALAKMYRGTLTADAAHDAAVKGVQAIVVNFLSS